MGTFVGFCVQSAVLFSFHDVAEDSFEGILVVNFWSLNIAFESVSCIGDVCSGAICYLSKVSYCFSV